MTSISEPQTAPLVPICSPGFQSLLERGARPVYGHTVRQEDDDGFVVYTATVDRNERTITCYREETEISVADYLAVTTLPEVTHGRCAYVIGVLQPHFEPVATPLSGFEHHYQTESRPGGDAIVFRAEHNQTTILDEDGDPMFTVAIPAYLAVRRPELVRACVKAYQKGRRAGEATGYRSCQSDLRGLLGFDGQGQIK